MHIKFLVRYSFRFFHVSFNKERKLVGVFSAALDQSKRIAAYQMIFVGSKLK